MKRLSVWWSIAVFVGLVVISYLLSGGRFIFGLFLFPLTLIPFLLGRKGK